MCEQQRRATVGERLSSRIKTLSGAKPCLFSGNVALGSPKWGLCFHGCGPRSGNAPSFLTLWWAQLCPRLAQHRLGFAHLAVMSMVVFRLFVFAIGLLRRFLYPILDPLAFAPNLFSNSQTIPICPPFPIVTSYVLCSKLLPRRVPGTILCVNHST